MPIDLNTFRTLAESSWFSSRDIVVQGPDNAKTATLGNLVFSSGEKVNKDTMIAFKAALEAEYGVFGTHAFDTVVGTRQQMKKSLRASDVKATLSHLQSIKEQRFLGELNRQLDVDPTVCSLSPTVRNRLNQLLSAHPYGNPPVDLAACRSQEELTDLVAKTISRTTTRAITQVSAQHGDIISTDLAHQTHFDEDIAPDQPTGLLNFSTESVFKKGSTSIEDRVKNGSLGSGMRINRSETNPVLFQELKTYGVEPGFIARNDWSLEDTRGLMADIWSEGSQIAINDIVGNSEKLMKMLDRVPPPSFREIVMAAGRAHPAGVAAVAEFVLQRDLANPNSKIAKAFAQKCPAINPDTLFPDDGGEPEPAQKLNIATVKRALFTEIRDAVMNEPPGSADHEKSPIFHHFSDRKIVKLDYNEGDRRVRWSSESKGKFRLPERVGVKGGRVKGAAYRTFRLTTADKASVGAVREALANDITRILGVPAQELSLVRGEYSDGHPKFMLSAKMETTYKDLEKGFLVDGQAVPEHGGKSIEPLGKYKALFLALADRDAVGSHGQNKGIREDADGNRTFFAIDPGHSLEGNGKDLKIHDDLSFRDTSLNPLEKRFLNFSVFDDDTRFNKFQGVLKLRDLANSPKLTQLFTSYNSKFDPNEPGISKTEKKLRLAVVKDIAEMQAEFTTQVQKILHVFSGQLSFYDDLAPQGAATQEKAIETISNLEKLTSPTSWRSPEGTVELKHLAVDQNERIPWKASVRPDGNYVYSTKGPLDFEARERLRSFCGPTDVVCTFDADGGASITVPAASSDAFFAAMDEDNVARVKHPEEYRQRAQIH